jgi:hypothetical protein
MSHHKCVRRTLDPGIFFLLGNALDHQRHQPLTNRPTNRRESSTNKRHNSILLPAGPLSLLPIPDEGGETWSRSPVNERTTDFPLRISRFGSIENSS